MKKQVFPLLLITLLLILGCKNTNTEIIEDTVEIEETFSLPDGAIPITYYRNHIYFDSETDSVKGNFIFDTGASGLLIDSTFYANNYHTNSTYRTTKIHGVGTGYQSIISINKIFNFNFSNYTYQALGADVIKLKTITGDLSDGIIGESFFSNQKYLMEINYVHEYIVLHSDTNTIDLSTYSKIKIKKQFQSIKSWRFDDKDIKEEASKFLVPATIQINDSLRITKDFILDIGAGGSIYLTTKVAKEHNLSANIIDKFEYYNTSSGIGGNTSGVTFTANFVEIGNYKLQDVIMSYSNDKSGALAGINSYNSKLGNDYGGLLGNLILEHFDIVIDFSDNAFLYLKPNQNYDKPFEFSKLGFSYKNRNKTLFAWIVTGFCKDSPAEKSGLQVNDEIVFVNGVSILDISYEEEENFWKQLDRIELVILRNGEEMTFEFELFEN